MQKSSTTGTRNIKKVAGKVPNQSRWMPFRSEVLNILLLVLVYFSGSTYFHFVHNDWTLAQSFYYSVQSGLSIGFGVLAETDDTSRLFTVVHVILGAILISLAFGLLLERVLDQIESRLVSNKIEGRSETSFSSMIGAALYSAEIALGIVWIMIGVFIGVKLEGWSVTHSLYYAVTGISTAGLEGPSNVDFNLWVTAFYVLIGVPIFSSATGKVASSILEYRRLYKLQASVQSAQITTTKFRRLSSATRISGSGANAQNKKTEDSLAIDRIDRHAFLCYELVSLGIVKQKTIEMINEKFDRIDETADGYITVDEAHKQGYLKKVR